MLTLLPLLALAATANAHTAAWAPGMYCRGGADPTIDDQNTNLVVNPLYQLSKQDWWFQHDRGCDKVPPPAGEFLELPAGGSFTVEHAHNRAFTTLSYGGKLVTDWPDGKQHPEDWNGLAADPGEGCIQDDGALHVQNETSATGTAFAISYESDISKVTMENLAVFTVAEHTPWKRLATFQVPELPACPLGGCHCAWLWVPKGCGQPNMYMQGFKCNVTGATSTATLAAAQPPTYCSGDALKCVQGAKQMIAWNQAEENNVSPPSGVTPSYHAAWGFLPGAQNDIFVAGAAKSSSSVVSSSMSPSTSSKPASIATSSSVSFSVSPIVKAASTTSSPTSSKVSSSFYSSVLYANTTSGFITPIATAPLLSSYSSSIIPAKPVATSVTSSTNPTRTTLSTKFLPIASLTASIIPSGAPAAPTKISDADFASLKAYIDGAWGKWMKDHGF